MACENQQSIRDTIQSAIDKLEQEQADVQGAIDDLTDPTLVLAQALLANCQGQPGPPDCSQFAELVETIEEALAVLSQINADIQAALQLLYASLVLANQILNACITEQGPPG